MQLQVLGIGQDIMWGYALPISQGGFQDGATVMIGVEALVEADWLSGNQLSISVPRYELGIMIFWLKIQMVAYSSGWLWIQSPDEMAANNELQCEDITVYFDLDKATITDDSQSDWAQQECLSQMGIPIREKDTVMKVPLNIMLLWDNEGNSVQQCLVGQGCTFHHRNNILWRRKTSCSRFHSRSVEAEPARRIIFSQ